MDMDVAVDSCPVVPNVNKDRAMVAMVGLDAIQMGGRILKWSVSTNVRSGIFTMILKQSTACLFMVVIYMIGMSRIGRILVTSCMRNMWSGVTWMPQKEWNCWFVSD